MSIFKINSTQDESELNQDMSISNSNENVCASLNAYLTYVTLPLNTIIQGRKFIFNILFIRYKYF